MISIDPSWIDLVRQKNSCYLHKANDIYMIQQSKIFITCLFMVISTICFSATYGPFELTMPIQKSEIWINPGLLSHHFKNSQEFNSFNYGAGIEYKFSNVSSIAAGVYKNSYYQQSKYIGVHWQPIALGPVNMGIFAGGFNGYANTNNGGWFPGVIPAFTMEGKLFGVNLLVIPTLPNRVAGSIAAQLKIKVFE